MRIGTIAAVSFVAIAIAMAPVSLSASDRTAEPKKQVKAEPAPAGQFAALKRVNAAPMTARELDAIKGQHIHFVTDSNNVLFGEQGLHLVNRNNTDNWSDLYGDGPVGPGYHGLCGAALNAPGIFIPGQNPVTGHGGGC